MVSTEMFKFPESRRGIEEVKTYLHKLEIFVLEMEKMAQTEMSAKKKIAARFQAQQARTLLGQRFAMSLEQNPQKISDFITSAKRILGEPTHEADVIPGPRPTPRIFRKENE